MSMKGLQLLKFRVYRLDMGHVETWHVMVPWMQWDGGRGGAMDVKQGGDVTCQHGIYANNVMGYGRASHELWGDGVLSTSWMCWWYSCIRCIHFLWLV
jgi:hypothetical protein